MRFDTPPSDYACAFAPGLTNPSIGAPYGVIAYEHKRVDRRYDVYRNNVTVSLIDALASIYPSVQRIVGVEFFRAMARFHVRETLPVSPLLFEYGRDFPNFIASYEYARMMPWLADTARIERAWLDAYHAADLPTLTADAFAAIAPDALAAVHLVRHPATRIVRSPYPAASIFAMNRADGPVTPLRSGEPEDALVTRPAYDVIVSLLPPGGAAFLISLTDGASLGDAVALALEDNPAFDLPAALRGMIEAGVFTAVHSGA
ncbi:putative DNA-binding domain-containing protein [Burkholderia theae]|uniref:HvfC/BufC family peptide modification chaperone n=1 Tax=Burkholderia theae TaxID=3143496 RepID=UPI003AFAA9BD